MSYYLQFLLIPHGSSCVLHPASFNRSSSVPLHHAHCHTICYSAWHPAAKHIPNQGRMHSSFRKLLHGSLGSITLLRRYFISAGFSPPAALFYFARRQPHLGSVHLAAAIAHSSLISQSIAKVHLHSSAPFVSASWRKIYCGGFLCSWHRIRSSCFTASPFVGARRPPP